MNPELAKTKDYDPESARIRRLRKKFAEEHPPARIRAHMEFEDDGFEGEVERTFLWGRPGCSSANFPLEGDLEKRRSALSSCTCLGRGLFLLFLPPDRAVALALSNTSPGCGLCIISLSNVSFSSLISRSRHLNKGKYNGDMQRLVKCTPGKIHYEDPNSSSEASFRFKSPTDFNLHAGGNVRWGVPRFLPTSCDSECGQAPKEIRKDCREVEIKEINILQCILE